MKRKIAALLMGTTLSVAVCGYSVQAMTYGYDMGGKVFISEDSSSSNLTEKEYDQWTKEMEALEAAAGRESSYVQEAVDTETGSIIHMFAYDEDTVTEANDGSATETAVVTEDVVSNCAEQKDTVENAVETAEGTCAVGDNLNSEIKIQEYKQNGIDLDSATGSWMWHGKEVHLLMDEDGSFYQNGSKEAKDNKIYLIVKREDDGRIKTVKQITMEEVMAERIAHLN